MFIDQLDHLIAATIHSSQHSRFVFPSQVAADWRLRRALEYGSFQALRKERFISWDTFKEECFDEERKEKPVNGAVRMLFCDTLLEENSSASQPLFSELVPPEYRDFSKSYRSLLVGILPNLEPLAQHLMDEKEGSFPPLLREDYLFLTHRYRAFLSERGLFEPGTNKPDPKPLKGETFLIFPEVVEDFGEYRPLLEPLEGLRIISGEALYGESKEPQSGMLHGIEPAGAGSVRGGSVGGGNPSGSESTLYRYTSGAQEMARLMDRITALLKGGTLPREIAITLPDMEQWRDRLEEEAKNRSLLLRFRSGRPLSESVPGRFFRLLYETNSGGWEFEKLDSLLMDRAIPWQQPVLLRRLLLFGRDYYCHRDPHRWESSLNRAGKDVLLSTFSSLRRGVEELLAAKSFLQLKERIQPFLRSRLDAEGWSERDLPLLQRSLDALEELVRAESIAQFSSSLPVFPLWIEWLGKKQYVPRQERGGIPVYDYRVSAGISPEHHFIPGCGQQKSRALRQRYPFLPEHLRKELPDAEIDLSAPFLFLYSRVGKGALFSFSEAGFGGPDLPPSELLSLEHRKQGAPDQKAPDQGGLGLEGLDLESQNPGVWIDPLVDPWIDPYRHEADWWLGTASVETLWPLQIRGLEGYFPVDRAMEERRKKQEPGINGVTTSFGEGDYAALLIDSLLRGRDRFEVSPNLLESFFGCPFSFFIDRVLKARSPELDIRFSDARIVGNLFHHAAALFFQLLGSQKPYSAFTEEEIGEAANSALDETFTRWQRGGDPVPLPPVAGSLERLIRRALIDFATLHGDSYPAFRTMEVEEELESSFDGASLSAGPVSLPLILKGRLDWLGRNDRDYLIVDYKKRLRLKQASLSPADEESFPASFQIPFYRRLAEGRGYQNCGAAYYDVTEAKYVPVFGEAGKKPWFSGEEAAVLTDGVNRAVGEMSRRIGRGDYRAVEDCQGCGHRGVCRLKFHIGS